MKLIEWPKTNTMFPARWKFWDFNQCQSLMEKFLKFLLNQHNCAPQDNCWNITVLSQALYTISQTHSLPPILMSIQDVSTAFKCCFLPAEILDWFLSCGITHLSFLFFLVPEISPYKKNTEVELQVNTFFSSSCRSNDYLWLSLWFSRAQEMCLHLAGIQSSAK